MRPSARSRRRHRRIVKTRPKKHSRTLTRYCITVIVPVKFAYADIVGG